MPSRRSVLSVRLCGSLSPLALILGLGGAAAEDAAPARPAPEVPMPPQPVRTVEPAPGQPAQAQPAKPPAEGVAAADSSGVPPAGVPVKKSRELPPLVIARVSADPVPTLSPATFLDTLRMAERYQGLADAGGWGTLPADLVLKPGMRHPAILELRGHLTLTGDLGPGASASDQLDGALVAAVRLFQARHGLPETGLVGRQTVAALNVPASVRQRQLAASAARLIGSAFAFGERYVVANIPSATVEAVERGVVARRYVAVVGRPERATPAIETRITNINLNPTWTVPVSLIKKDIIPHMRKNPGYLAKMHIRMLDAKGEEVQPTSIDWSTERAVNYTLRQDPGFDNSLGQVRIDMPNRHAIYMHDTPSKNLFTRDVRFHSSGCVRVAGVKEFVGWLLEGTPGPNAPGSTWGPIEIETGIAVGERRDIKLVKPVPVAFVYLTGYATPDGRAHFRDDIYGLDNPSAPPAEVATTAAILAKPAVKAAPAKAPAVAKPSPPPGH